ncbi:MAG: flagellar hook-basal body complex protein [Candidatus Sericytochromatia bacterium]|nr:flagellar hook-basal body complex protein [Candidatus Tanganyikabacteria bacterium]
MDIRISAVNSIQAIDQWLKVLAGNLTGSNVVGYRQQRVEFADVLTKHVSAEAPAAGGLSSVNPVDLPAGGMKIKATKTDFSQGSLQSTGQAADLAIQGDAFFILSKKKDPASLEDFVFTRNGSFHYDFVQEPVNDPKLGAGATKGVYRLVNQDGLFVMGFSTQNPKAYQSNAVANLPGRPNPPRETSGPTAGGGTTLTGVSQLGFDVPTDPTNPVGPAEGYKLGPIEIPFQHDPNPKPGGPFNINENFVPTFNSEGWVQVNADAPKAADGASKLVSFVALSKFADPTGLTKIKGGTEFGWNNTVGQTFTGIAGFGGGTIGKNNTLNPGSLETSNSSVNTTLPELTIAQKSFTANVKIVQVGNNLIDDVNNLVR